MLGRLQPGLQLICRRLKNTTACRPSCPPRLGPPTSLPPPTTMTCMAAAPILPTSTPPPTPPRLRVRAPRTLQQASTQTFLFLIVWTRHSASLSFVGSVCDALCPSVRFFMSVCTHLITIQCANGRYTCSLSSVLSPCPQSSEAVSGCVPLLQVPPLRAMSSCGHWRPASQTAISVLQRSWGSGLCSRGV